MRHGWIAETSDSSYQVTGLQIGDTYSFRTRADHADGTASPYSTQSRGRRLIRGSGSTTASPFGVDS
jgi:hypothetical protein